jgi:membrane protease YdiL (CAAX protease family)
MAQDERQSERTGGPWDDMKPMPIWLALLYFGLPALAFRLCLYWGFPALTRLGMSRFEAYIVSFVVPLAVLFSLAIGFYKRDGYPLRWTSFRARFRLSRMTGGDWGWAVGTLAVTFLSIGAFGGATQPLVRAIPAVGPPAFFPPWLQIGVPLNSTTFASFIGAPLQGNWGVLLLFGLVLFFNIAGEELWWRGYILPRQERAHGRWAWAVNGVLWWLWHLAFYPWQVFALLPICLALPFVAQRRRSTWVALVIHLQNGAAFLLVLAMVVGRA